MSDLWVKIVVPIFIFLANVCIYAVNEHSVIRRRLVPNWTRNLLGCSNRAPGVPPAERPQGLWAFSLISPTHLMTCSLTASTVGTILLLLLRISALVYYVTAMVLFGPAEYDTLQSWWLTYYTDWTFTLFGLLAIVGVGSTAHALLTAGKAEVQVAAAPTSTAHDASSMAGTPPDTPKFVGPGGDVGGRKAVTWRWWQVFHQLLFTVVAPSELFLTVYYWITIGDISQLGVEILIHGTNNIFLLLDVLLSRVPMVSYQLHAFFLYVTLYAIFMWIYGSVSGTWPYEDLNWDDPSSVGWYAALVFVVIGFWYVYFGLACAREAVVRWRTRTGQGKEGEREKSVLLHNMTPA